MNIIKKFSILILVFSLLSGCNSMSPIKGPNTPRNILEMVEPGDLIQIETIDGQIHEFKVSFISTESIKGEQIEIALKDIQTINSEQFSLVRTSSAGVGLVLINALILHSVFSSL